MCLASVSLHCREMTAGFVAGERHHHHVHHELTDDRDLHVGRGVLDGAVVGRVQTAGRVVAGRVHLGGLLADRGDGGGVVVITIRCSRLANLGQVLIEPRPVVRAELHLERVVPLADEIQDRLLAHERDRVRVGPVVPPPPVRLPNKRVEDVLRIEPRRARRVRRRRLEIHRVHGRDLPVRLPGRPADRELEARVGLAGRQPAREHLVDGRRLRDRCLTRAEPRRSASRRCRPGAARPCISTDRRRSC